MCQLEQNKKLTSTFPGLVYTKEKHNYNTRSTRKNFLDIPLCQTFTYGTQSCKYQCIQEGKLNWEPNLSCCKKYTQKEYSGLLLVFLHIFFYSICLQNQQRKKCNVYIINIIIIIIIIIIYLTQSSESSEYSWDFCQHNPKFEKLM